MQYLDFYASEFENLSVACHDSFKLGRSIWSVHDRRTGGLAQVEVARYEIGVEMGFENVFQDDAVAFQALDIGLDFAERIDYHGVFTRSDVIGALCQAAGVNLFYVKCCLVHDAKFVVVDLDCLCAESHSMEGITEKVP
jgi:hypothetical protein